MSGRVVILNGAPRSGKSSIVAAVQETFDEPWLNLGADLWVREVTPPRYRPGIGLRPGAERPDLEPFVVSAFAALYDSIAAHCRQGLNVVANVGHHDAYSKSLGILQTSARQLDGFGVLFVGVKCPIEAIMARRQASSAQGDDHYMTASPDDPFPAPVRRWQEEVHRPEVYDLEVDTSVLSPEDCAAEIGRRLRTGRPATRSSASPVDWPASKMARPRRFPLSGTNRERSAEIRACLPPLPAQRARPGSWHSGSAEAGICFSRSPAGWESVGAAMQRRRPGALRLPR